MGDPFFHFFNFFLFLVFIIVRLHDWRTGVDWCAAKVDDDPSRIWQTRCYGANEYTGPNWTVNPEGNWTVFLC